jgi:hypothetical protein
MSEVAMPDDNPTDKCPTCGRRWDTNKLSAEQLVALMKIGSADVYLAQNGCYYISHGLGRVRREAIDAALAAGLIREKYQGHNHEYWEIAHD